MDLTRKTTFFERKPWVKFNVWVRVKGTLDFTWNYNLFETVTGRV